MFWSKLFSLASTFNTLISSPTPGQLQSSEEYAIWIVWDFMKFAESSTKSKFLSYICRDEPDKIKIVTNTFVGLRHRSSVHKYFFTLSSKERSDYSKVFILLKYGGMVVEPDVVQLVSFGELFQLLAQFETVIMRSSDRIVPFSSVMGPVRPGTMEYHLCLLRLHNVMDLRFATETISTGDIIFKVLSSLEPMSYNKEKKIEQDATKFVRLSNSKLMTHTYGSCESFDAMPWAATENGTKWIRVDNSSHYRHEACSTENVSFLI